MDFLLHLDKQMPCQLLGSEASSEAGTEREKRLLARDQGREGGQEKQKKECCVGSLFSVQGVCV